MKMPFKPIDLSKEQEKFLQNNAITNEGIRKVIRGELDFFDMEHLLVMNYLSQKLVMLRKNFKKLKDRIDDYNDTVELAFMMKPVHDIKTNINGEPLVFFELELNESHHRP
jgi:hypothetical protein